MASNAKLSVDDILNIRRMEDTDAVLLGGALFDSLTQPLDLVRIQFGLAATSGIFSKSLEALTIVGIYPALNGIPSNGLV